jgi:hypothetical protein
MFAPVILISAIGFLALNRCSRFERAALPSCGLQFRAKTTRSRENSKMSFQRAVKFTLCVSGADCASSFDNCLFM